MAKNWQPPETRAFFDRCGRYLFGEHYAWAMANALGVNPETVRKWRSGKSTIPPNVIRELYKMAEDRQPEFTRLSAAAKTMLSERPA